MDDYRALVVNTSSSEWAKKYTGLKRNYDSMSRICKEKCLRNTELEGEINVFTEVKQKYDALFIKNKEHVEQNCKLIKENYSLQNAVTELKKKLNLSETNINDMKQSLKYKSQVQIELEDAIQNLSNSLSETKEQHHQNQGKVKEYDVCIQNLKIKIQELQDESKNLQKNVNDLKSENENLKTNVIQRDNIILSIKSDIKKINCKYIDRNNEYNKLIKQYENIEIKYTQIKSKCKNYEIDIDIFKNRLKHENNEKNEREGNVNEKIESLRKTIIELETQNKYNMITIDNLTKIKMENIQFKQKYNELQQSNDLIEEKIEIIEKKYNNLQENYQANNEKYGKLESKFNENKIENNNLQKNISEKENELQQMHKQYFSLNNTYNDLQQEYKSYLHKTTKNRKLCDSNEIQILSERQSALKNDFQCLLLENEEWIKKYNNLNSNYDALNDDYINCKNHSLQIESLLNETKSFQQKNIQQIKKLHTNEMNELKREIKLLNDKITDIKNANITLKNKPTLTISEYTMLCEKECRLSDIINKMYISDQSCEPSFKCMLCNDLFIDPVTCQPCGHSFCRKCIKNKKDICNQCKVKITYFSNEVLENLTNKFKMRFKTYLPTLQQIAKRKTNVSGVS